MILVATATAVAVVVLIWSLRFFGADSVWFAFFVVWVPMTWLGTISRVITPRVPAGYLELRPFERDGRLYEMLGVGVAKRLLRRGPMAAFNPGLHLPSDPTPERIAVLDQRMRAAEASHAILAVLTMVIVAYMAVRGWWMVAGCTLLFDVLMNGYPVMLQRYNRARLAARFGGSPTGNG
jgi:Glycosyl-4,4'-diaponeurosporenoate acyltransferase